MQNLPPKLQHDAERLIRALSTVAGDEDRVLEVLKQHAHGTSIERTKTVAAAALAITFAECITNPVSLNRSSPAPITIPKEQ
ncbi:hypothetical protein [Hoyosella altamirensis]|uniref:Uncharacterized protein n=1 Tax=Hoyosella altamirensis TaxID=616997 RepID=A0A839RRJ9_9ACTN|nr:hypothetical protein [Hoyosella altamirensis]MBB3038977.1 hypothetical protein [Hoyosella altamirensis]